jgi:hypothetical protein
MFRPRPTVESILDQRLLRYKQDFFDGAVLMAYENLKLAQSGAIFNGSPQIVLRATFDALVFQPRVGATLVGHVNKLGEGHIGMLVAGIFNASIPDSGGAILQDYSYDREGGVWRSPQRGEKSGNKKHDGNDDKNVGLPANIRLKSEILFCVDRVTESHGMFSISGRMKRGGAKKKQKRRRQGVALVDLGQVGVAGGGVAAAAEAAGADAGATVPEGDGGGDNSTVMLKTRENEDDGRRESAKEQKKKKSGCSSASANISSKKKKRKREASPVDSESTDDQTLKKEKKKKKKRRNKN